MPKRKRGCPTMRNRRRRYGTHQDRLVPPGGGVVIAVLMGLVIWLTLAALIFWPHY